MPMTLDQLRTFLQIVRQGSVRAAATSLHVTQPALSARLASLEASLGTALFERRGQGLVLTKAGADLVPLAQQMIDLAGRITAAVTPDDQLTGLVRIGAAETIAQAWLPALISAVQARYEALTIEVSVDISVNLRDQLLDRTIDLAFLMGPVSEYSTENIDLPTFELGWFVAPVLLEDGPPDLATVPVITYARNTRPFRELKSALTERHGPSVRLFPSSSLSACFEMVAAGLGVGVLPTRLGASRVVAGHLATFDPGWMISPLRFTASYVGEPENPVVREAAKMAAIIAEEDDQ
ncbi:MAG: LysR family transcriptional regulator [Pseudomonadota bacterium]